MAFADLELSRRLERAEGQACVQFAAARGRLFPQCGSAWMECAGGYAVFDRIDSPLTQSFGLGIFEELSGETLDAVERFFRDRGAAVVHELSPLAGVAALQLLCARGYRPIEVSSVLYLALGATRDSAAGDIRVRVAGEGEGRLWAQISARGWSHEYPGLGEFLGDIGTVASACEGSVCFLGEVAGAAGALSIYEGVGLLGGAATVPELRRRGLQTALIEERLRYAFEQGCDLAMMVAEAGSKSQRNAERRGFRVAYTRMKWQLGV